MSNQNAVTQKVLILTITFLAVAGISGFAEEPGSLPSEPAWKNPALLTDKPPGENKAFKIPGINLQMVFIPHGSFIMGDSETKNMEVARDKELNNFTLIYDVLKNDPRGNPHVTLTNDYWMGKYEITQEEWLSIMKRRPIFPLLNYDRTGYINEKDIARRKSTEGIVIDRLGDFPDPFFEGGTYPVYHVTWKDAREFCIILTEQERKAGRLPKGYVYRLPTEAEWEYACRAGTTGKFNVENWEKLPNVKSLPSFNRIGNFAANPMYDLPSKGQVVRVGQYLPNKWGLYDMHGNVPELCLDFYQTYRGDQIQSEFVWHEDGELINQNRKLKKSENEQINPFFYNANIDTFSYLYSLHSAPLIPRVARGGSNCDSPECSTSYSRNFCPIAFSAFDLNLLESTALYSDDSKFRNGLGADYGRGGQGAGFRIVLAKEIPEKLCSAWIGQSNLYEKRFGVPNSKDIYVMVTYAWELLDDGSMFPWTCVIERKDKSGWIEIATNKYGKNAENIAWPFSGVVPTFAHDKYLFPGGKMRKWESVVLTNGTLDNTPQISIWKERRNSNSKGMVERRDIVIWPNFEYKKIKSGSSKGRIVRAKIIRYDANGMPLKDIIYSNEFIIK